MASKSKAKRLAPAPAVEELPKFQFCIMTVGTFPYVEREADRLALQQQLLESVEKTIDAYRERGILPTSTRMRVERAEDFPL